MKTFEQCLLTRNASLKICDVLCRMRTINTSRETREIKMGGKAKTLQPTIIPKSLGHIAEIQHCKHGKKKGKGFQTANCDILFHVNRGFKPYKITKTNNSSLCSYANIFSSSQVLLFWYELMIWGSNQKSEPTQQSIKFV